MRTITAVLCVLAVATGPAVAQSSAPVQSAPSVPAQSTAAAPTQSCPGNPDAIGTSRTITVDPSVLPQVGTMQYETSLPLNDHEVVLTFDDGPLPPNTGRILDTLAANCVKADYFLVGEMARTYPALVRRIYNSGHVIGTHSLDHPLTFNHMKVERIADEVDGGIAAVQAAAGDPRAVAPFFRVPGLLHNKTVDGFLASKSLSVWSADEVADDWHHGITAKQIVKLAISRIEAKNHRGVLLLHDIHPATAAALPILLKELKARGYHIVQAIPAGERIASVPELPAKPHMAAASHAAVKTVEHSAKVRIAHHRHRRRHHPARDRADAAIEKAAASHKAQTADSGQNWLNLWR
jgi:peptidoglycan/xylan/chitin deacetylase (PgdA/CDA1 family)